MDENGGKIQNFSDIKITHSNDSFEINSTPLNGSGDDISFYDDKYHNEETQIFEDVKNEESDVFSLGGSKSFPSSEPSELNFDPGTETNAEKLKRERIELALEMSSTTLETWRCLAKDNYGLINDNLRKRIWPLLLEIDPKQNEPMPSLDELKKHAEYQQVVLDVNRSLKRFPPGIPYEQRVALQDQLTVLILRVIMKYPHLKYYQGYHDVAITFLLVVGEEMAYRIMTRLSTNNFKECMESTLDKTSFRLNYIYPLIEKEHPQLFEYLERSNLGTIFALPWYLTWFGHSLSQYRDVVRLYDYFLASPPLAPIYVAAMLVMERADDIFSVDCDMASVHCLLNDIPDNLPFEKILINATKLYEKYPPETIERDVIFRIEKEKQMRKLEEERAAKFRAQRQKKNEQSVVRRQLFNLKQFLIFWIPFYRADGHLSKYRLFLATATLAIATLAYYKNNDSFSLYFNR